MAVLAQVKTARIIQRMSFSLLTRK